MIYSVEEITGEVKLTDSIRQNIFNFIIHFCEVNTFPPTVGDIQEFIRVSQKRNIRQNLIRYHLDQLSKTGKIVLRRRGKRNELNIAVVHASWRFHGYRDVKK